MAIPAGLLLLALMVGLWTKEKRSAPDQGDPERTADRHGNLPPADHSGRTRRSARLVRSHFPGEDLPQEFAEHFNIASIRSSLGPRLIDGKNRLADYLPTPPRFTANRIIYNRDGADHEFEIVGRGDFTHDGLEDLQIRHLDRGTRYPVISTFLVTRRSPDGPISFLRADETRYPAGGNGEIHRIDHHADQAFDRGGFPIDH